MTNIQSEATQTDLSNLYITREELQKLTNRENAIAALQIARDSLIYAIKTERILRKNRALIKRNLNLLTNDRSSLQALQINVEASEYSSLLNEVVQLTIDVQTEMTRLPPDN